MIRSFQIVVLLGLLSLFVGNCSGPEGGCSLQSGPSNPYLGAGAPDFSLLDLSGQPVQFSELARKKPTLLIFWATWCPSCREEVPVLNEWTERYPGLEIVGINVEEPADRVKKFSARYGVRYQVLLDEEGEVAQQYGLVGIPASVLTNREGKIIYYGFALPRNIERLIQE